MTGSTISGNSATALATAAASQPCGNLTVTDSTISGNSAESGGGGIWVFEGPVTITNSIVAGNWRTSGTDPPVADDLVGSGIFTLGYSIVGAAAGAINTLPCTINYFGVDPRLGPLADNGGPTQTRALLPGSPATGAGDPAAVAGVGGVPLYDQRGAPWSRVVGGRLDIGAVESQPNPLLGDYNFNGLVDPADYTVWRDTLGSTHLVPTAMETVWSISRTTIGGGRISVRRCRQPPAVLPRLRSPNRYLTLARRSCQYPTRRPRAF